MNKIRPNFLTAIGKSYLRSLLNPIPIWVHLYVTHHCNLKCKYCGVRDNHRKDPTFDEICQMVLKLKSLGCHFIALMGGEPTLRKDIVEIVKFCSKNQVYTQLSTNGHMLINPSRNENGRTLLMNLALAGIGIINLSVDSVASGFDVSTKELPKNNQVLDALIKERKERGLLFLLNCVIVKQNIKQIPLMLEFCNSKKIMMAAIFVQNPHPDAYGNMVGYTDKIFFEKKDTKIVCEMADYLISKKKSGHFLWGPIDYYKSIKKWVKGDFVWNCDAGKYTFDVDTDGKIGICSYLPYSNTNLMELDKNFFKKIEQYRKSYQKWCTKRCLSSCTFCSTFYRQNPLKFLCSKLRYKLSQIF